MAEHLVAYPNNGLFMASLDHSPSEQLTGKTWHTSALVLSAAAEHDALAKELGKDLNPRTGALTPWVSANEKYRRNFLLALARALSSHRVLALCFSAQEDFIARNERNFVSLLQLEDRYERQIRNNKDIVTVGPFSRNGDSAPEYVQAPANQALMALFIAFNLRRIRDCMQSETAVPVWWQIYSDRPPNNFDGPLSKFTHVLLSAEWGPRTSRKFTWGGFTEDKKIGINLLVDNLAGAVNKVALSGFKSLSALSQANQTGSAFFQIDIFG